MSIFRLKLSQHFFSTKKNTHAQQRGKKTLLSLTLICYCYLVGKVQIVRGSTCTTMKHRYLLIWLTYCIKIANHLNKTIALNVVECFLRVPLLFSRSLSQRENERSCLGTFEGSKNIQPFSSVFACFFPFTEKSV